MDLPDFLILIIHHTYISKDFPFPPLKSSKTRSETQQQGFQHHLHSNNLKHLFLASLNSTEHSNKKLNRKERVV